MSSNSNKQIFSMPTLECSKVVVFQDRAEIRRLLKATLKKGENELVINSVSQFIDRDSVRVEGHGDACVLDVVCESKSVESGQLDNNQKIKDLNLEIEDLENQRDQTNFRLQRIEKQTSVLHEFANNIAKPLVKDGLNESAVTSQSSRQNVDNFLSFMETYSGKLEALDLQKFQVQKELKQLEEKIKVAYENRDRLTYSHNYNESIEITILVETSKEETEVNLIVSYLVYNASWSPKYDIRVSSKDKTMTINYFGLISQTTGEDWNDTKLSLSTAVPSIGGNVPELETQNVRIKQPIEKIKSIRPMAMMKMDRFELCEKAEVSSFSMEPRIQHQVAEASISSVGSTSTFDIPRQATIPSESKSHKVSIGIISLKPEFEYETVPKKYPHAYIKAKVTNKSQYSLLAGPANVFLDNNFVAKIDLKSYSPQEEFNCSLGVDPGIRIDYKPVRKFKTQSGLINKVTSTTYVQVIEVKNTTQYTAKLLLSENLPLSNDDKIQVKLLEPVLKNQTSIRLNKSNNLEFDLVLEPSKTEEITIKYTVENPSDKEIEFF